MAKRSKGIHIPGRGYPAFALMQAEMDAVALMLHALRAIQTTAAVSNERTEEQDIQEIRDVAASALGFYESSTLPKWWNEKDGKGHSQEGA